MEVWNINFVKTFFLLYVNGGTQEKKWKEQVVIELVFYNYIIT